MECELKDITVYYELFGEGRPIIMLHGWSLDHRSMQSDMEPLFRHRRGWKRIYLDLPGHGRTPGKDWITNQDNILDVVLDFIDRVLPGQRFVVAGASAGAYLARGIAYHRPAVLDGLLLVVPLIVADDAKRQVPSHITLVEEPALMAGLESDMAEALNQLAVVQSQKWVDAWKAVSDSAVGMGDQKFQAKIRETPKIMHLHLTWTRWTSHVLLQLLLSQGDRILSLAIATPGKSSRTIRGQHSSYSIEPGTACTLSRKNCTTCYSTSGSIG